MTPETARGLAIRFGIPLHMDFHALPSAAVGGLLEAADVVAYRQPRNANGSRARCFHAKLARAVKKAKPERWTLEPCRALHRDGVHVMDLMIAGRDGPLMPPADADRLAREIVAALNGRRS
jgi:hypothetical protein